MWTALWASAGSRNLPMSDDSTCYRFISGGEAPDVCPNPRYCNRVRYDRVMKCFSSSPPGRAATRSSRWKLSGKLIVVQFAWIGLERLNPLTELSSPTPAGTIERIDLLAYPALFSRQPFDTFTLFLLRSVFFGSTDAPPVERFRDRHRHVVITESDGTMRRRSYDTAGETYLDAVE